jgi:hypothetical protein
MAVCEKKGTMFIKGYLESMSNPILPHPAFGMKKE